MILFNYYSANIKKSCPLGLISLQKFKEKIKNPNNEVKEMLYKIRNTTDEKEKGMLKERLYSFTPCVLCSSRRNYSNIIKFTGLMVLDFDFKKETQDYAESYKSVLPQYDFIHAAWLSSSGKGVRALIKIPVVVSVDEFKSYFNYIVYKHEIGTIMGFDKSPQNPVLPLFISYDENIYVNENSSVLEKTYIKTVPKYEPVFLDSTKSNYSPKSIYTIAKNNIDKISDCGHPILRATSYVVGGYVGGGFLYQQDAIDIMHGLIDGNSYLSKKAKTYKTTAIEMIKKGMNDPIFEIKKQ